RPLEREMEVNAASSQHQDTLFRYDGQRRMDQMKVESGASGPMTELWRWDLGMGAEGHLLTEQYYEHGMFNRTGSKGHNLTTYYGLAVSNIGLTETDFTVTYQNAGFDTEYLFTYATGHNRPVDTVNNGSEFDTTSYTVQTNSHRYASVD